MLELLLFLLQLALFQCIFHIQKLFLNQKIEVRITKIGIKGLKIIFEHEIYSEQDIAITGTATVLAYNYEEQKVKKVPANFKEIVEKYLV